MKILTLKEVSEMTGLAVKTLYQRIYEGTLPTVCGGFQDDGRAYLVEERVAKTIRRRGSCPPGNHLYTADEAGTVRYWLRWAWGMPWAEIGQRTGAGADWAQQSAAKWAKRRGLPLPPRTLEEWPDELAWVPSVGVRLGWVTADEADS